MKETRRSLIRLLTTKDEVVVLDPKAHFVLLNLGLELALKGKTVAKITKAYKDTPQVSGAGEAIPLF